MLLQVLLENGLDLGLEGVAAQKRELDTIGSMLAQDFAISSKLDLVVNWEPRTLVEGKKGSQKRGEVRQWWFYSISTQGQLHFLILSSDSPPESLGSAMMALPFGQGSMRERKRVRGNESNKLEGKEKEGPAET